MFPHPDGIAHEPTVVELSSIRAIE